MYDMHLYSAVTVFGQTSIALYIHKGKDVQTRC